MTTIKQYLIWFAVLLLYSIFPVQAATPPGLPMLGTQDPFSIPTSNLRSDADKKMPVAINEVGTLKLTQQFDNPQNIYALAITGQMALHSDVSSVKVIIVDNIQQREYLVYEAYPFLTDALVTPITAVCEESCLLSNIASFSLRIELEDASIQITELTYANAPKAGDPVAIKASQDHAKIQKLNEQNLGWLAGETSVSTLTYEEKKRLFLEPTVPNLQGFEYYLGGVFEIKLANPSLPSASTLVKDFTWGDRHGQNWITPVKNQDNCGSCWAFATTGTLETVTNLYFNRFLDLDLSEQDALSCSGAGSCGGGLPGQTLDYFQSTGIVDEACFVYSVSDESCSNKCSSPDELTKISGKISFGSSSHPKTEDTLKRMIIENGPVSGGIRTLLHAMTLVGFSQDSKGETIWIFKNSWGDRWGGKLDSDWGGDGQGNNGYAHVKLNVSNIDWTHAIQTPIINSNNYSINCEDKDGDQFCNWGISTTKPSTCPSFCKAQPDCDDSNPSAGQFDANYNCGTTPEPLPPPPPAEQQFTIHNDGNGVLSVTSITPETSAPWISILTPTPFDVSPGSSKPVSVRVDFSQAPTGQRTTRLLVNSNDPDESPFPNGVNIVVERPTVSSTTTSPLIGATSITPEPTIIQFQSLKSTYNVDEKVVVELVESGSRAQTVDLWIAIQLPTGDLLFKTRSPLFPFVSEPKPFKSSVSAQKTTQAILEFTVPPGMGGDYTFYALYVAEGQNPLTEGIEAVARSNLVTQTVTLAN